MSFARYLFEGLTGRGATHGVHEQLIKRGVSLSSLVEAETFTQQLIREGLYFDIETTGREVSSQILSMSIAQGITGKPANIFAQLATDPSKLDPFIRGVVLPGIEAAKQGAAALPEREAIQQAINLFQQHEGKALVTWAGGYAAARKSSGVVGYDIPHFIERAHSVGLGVEAETALSKMIPVDIGREYAYRISTELAHSGIDPLTWSLAGPPIKSARPYAEMKTSVHASTKFVRGWSQEFLHEYFTKNRLAGAHRSDIDIQAMQGLTERLLSGMPGFEARSYIQELRGPGGIYQRIQAEKETWQSLSTGQAIPWTKPSQIPVDQLSSSIKQWARDHRTPLTIGGIGLGAWITQPLSWFTDNNQFSGKDDNYNTIEGLRHGGLAELQRRRFTDFGSGWVGAKTLEEILPVVYTRFKKSFAVLDQPAANQIIAKTFSPTGQLEEVRHALSIKHLQGIIESSPLADKGLVEQAEQVWLKSIPKRHKAFNEIEGMGHDGIAHQIRKALTAFGSAWRGLVGGAKKMFSLTQQQALERIQMAPKIFGHMIFKDSLLSLQTGRPAFSGLFQKESPAWNEIKGMSKGGISEVARKKNTDFGSPVNLTKAIQRAAGLYEKLTHGHMKRLGMKTDDLFWTSTIQNNQLTVKASRGQEAIFQISREFKEKEIGLINIHLHEKLQGKGLGSSIYQAEPELFRLLGYESGETVIAPLVTSETTKKWIAKQYEATSTQTLGGYHTMTGRIPIKQKLQQIHKLAQKQHTMYTNKPGKQHMHKTGKIVGSS